MIPEIFGRSLSDIEEQYVFSQLRNDLLKEILETKNLTDLISLLDDISLVTKLNGYFLAKFILPSYTNEFMTKTINELNLRMEKIIEQWRTNS
jgi:hypothetical protein